NRDITENNETHGIRLHAECRLFRSSMIASSLVTCVCGTNRTTNRSMAVAMRMRRKGRCRRMNATGYGRSAAQVNDDVDFRRSRRARNRSGCELFGFDKECRSFVHRDAPRFRLMVGPLPRQFVWVLRPGASVAASF